MLYSYLYTSFSYLSLAALGYDILAIVNKYPHEVSTDFLRVRLQALLLGP